MHRTLRVQRTFWVNDEKATKADYAGVVDLHRCSWSLDSGTTDADGTKHKARRCCLLRFRTWPKLQNLAGASEPGCRPAALLLGSVRGSRGAHACGGLLLLAIGH